MANYSLTQIAKTALPALSGSALTYNAEKNVYLTLGYTSAAGNTYYKAVRLSDRLAIHYDIGEGYSRAFLNGITIFAWDGNKANIISRKTWGGYSNWVFFSEAFAKQQTINMLKEYLGGQAKMVGQNIPEHQLTEFCSQMIDDVHNYQKRLA